LTDAYNARMASWRATQLAKAQQKAIAFWETELQEHRHALLALAKDSPPIRPYETARCDRNAFVYPDEWTEAEIAAVVDAVQTHFAALGFVLVAVQEEEEDDFIPPLYCLRY